MTMQRGRSQRPDPEIGIAVQRSSPQYGLKRQMNKDIALVMLANSATHAAAGFSDFARVLQTPIWGASAWLKAEGCSPLHRGREAKGGAGNCRRAPASPPPQLK
jgi:hypothetical protein